MDNLYLDIDGVLIGKNQTIPEGIEEVLKIATDKYNCFWLTTHCKGNKKPVIEYLSRIYPKEYEAYWIKIKETNWDVLKTEAIDFNSKFVWLDDKPLQSELLQLERNNSLANLIIVNLKNSGEIERIKRILS